MSDVQTYKGTREDIARQAREHYEKISMEARHWNSTIPAALYAWQREPILVDALKQAFVTIALEPMPSDDDEWLHNVLADALGQAMDETAFSRWIAEITDDYGGPEQP